MAKFKYFSAFIIPLFGLFTFNTTGLAAYIGIFSLYVIVPLAENFLPSNTYNLSTVEKELANENFFYDLVLYLSVPLHLFVVYEFLITVSDPSIPLSDLIACILFMGTILGVNGINIGHELGHKTDHKFKQFLAHILLLTAIQNHFMTYHNSGHHRDVATPNDLTSAKEGDIFYWFALRSQIGGYDFIYIINSFSFCRNQLLFWCKRCGYLFYNCCLRYFSFRSTKLLFSLRS